MKVEFFLQKIKEEFPEITWSNYRDLNHSCDHCVIILDKKIVFRAPKDAHYKNQLKDEIQLLHYLKKKVKVGIPEYKYVSKDKSIAGYNILNGRELTVSRFQHLTASEKEIVAKQLAEFLTTLHTTQKSTIKKYHIGIVDQKKRYKKLVRDTKNILFPRLSKKDIKLIEEYFAELKAALGHNYSSVLIHNDLTGHNILWDTKKKQINVIDFSDLAFGDPAIDFRDLWHYGQRFTKRVFDLYGGKRDEQILKRSRLYFKNNPLFRMKYSLQDSSGTFKEDYDLFKERFKV